MIFAAALVLVFIGVVSSVPANRLAWQGPLVMGTLAMPVPHPAMLRQRYPRTDRNSLFSLLGFLSVVGVAALAGRWLLEKPKEPKSPRKPPRPPIVP